MTTPIPAGWYADPGGSGGWRWWDGTGWTEHVHVPPLPGQAGKWQQRAAARALGTQLGRPAQPGDAAWQERDVTDRQDSDEAASQQAEAVRSPYTEQRMFVSQKRKVIELANEYAVFGADGTQIGAVTEVGQSGAKRALRLLTRWDQFMTHTVDVRDALGRTMLVLTRPTKVIKSTMIVSRPDGGEVGRLVQRNMIGKIRFGIQSGESEIGSLNAENWRAWNFSIKDHTGAEVATITKTWEGLVTTVFTTADNYLVDIHRHLAEPMHSLVVAGTDRGHGAEAGFPRPQLISRA
jgi:uncharacterized protein YxjI